jgi:DNA-binding CsgD family transcriptional regulator
VISAIEQARSNWDFFLATWAVATDAGSPEEERANLARLRECMTQADWEIMATAWVASDIKELLPALTTPTLLLHPHLYLNVPIGESLKLASLITNARFTMIDGKSPLGNVVQGLRAIDDFLAGVRDPDAGDASKEPGSPAGLSARESEVLRLVGHGLNNQQIADELVISVNTVRRHVSNIFDKTGAANSAQATAYAKDHGIA